MTRKIGDYTVVEGDCAVDLNRQVMAHLKYGYELHGGVSVACTTNGEGTTGVWLAQAMVLYLPENGN